ncbi:MAG TPA: prepilin peptidase [Anaerolineales bacterium]|nr:prepilin peptidase [Anaerolineales bacterium]
MTISLIVPIIIGWLAGWIVNYISDVLPLTRKLSQPECLQCHATYPVLDYLLFKSCPNGHPRRARIWLVQLIAVAISLLTWYQPPSKIGYMLGMLLIVYFGVVIVIDMEHRLILHPTSIFGSLIALGLGLVSHGLVPTLLGGLGGFLIMMAFYALGMLFTRFRAKRMAAQAKELDDEEALGAGDVILVTILGFLVGWPLIWFSILFSLLLGGMVSFFYLIGLFLTRKYEENSLMMFIPYGPYFVISAFLITYFPRLVAAIVPG